ncbi:MAG: UbiA prenyltransferase family protein [Terriglobia bacterium]
MSQIRLYWSFARPFTLIPPMVGIFSGALIGAVAAKAPFHPLPVAMAIIAAGVLNAASNGLNQIFDLTNDRINKPHRALPSGRMTLRQAWCFTCANYVAALLLAAGVNRQVFLIYLFAALATIAYSAPPLRLKRHPWASNFVIALTRGELLKVAGWAAVATVLGSWEPWYIGFIYFLFLMGATTTKDFADLAGDRAAGCVTLPVKYGVKTSARFISPAFIVPWLVMALGVFLKVLSGDAAAILALSAVMLAWGSYVTTLINRDPRRLVSDGENHPGWRHMYWMMMTGHLGLAAAYLLSLAH